MLITMNTRLVFLLLLFFASLTNYSLHAQCDRVSDSLVLVSIYEETDGINWTITWDLIAPIDEWHGVELSTEGCVEKLFLNDNQLSGVLMDPALPHLTTLWLGKNELIGAIPDFENLPSLTTLSIGFNGLSGNIPDFAFLPNLVSLNCFRNQLTGVIPDFTNLENLQSLNLSENQLSGEIPDFSRLPDVKSIDLSENNLTGEIPDFTSLSELSSLLAHTNQLSGEIPDFANLPELTEIYVYNNQLSGNIPDFSNIPDSEVIALYGNQMTGSIPDFSAVPKLRQLYLGKNELSGSIPNFSNVEELSVIQLDENLLTGSIPDLSHLTKLEDFGVSYNLLEGCFPSFVCDIMFDAANNKSLPWIGNHHPYCDGQAQIGAPCDDCNDDLIDAFIDEDCACTPITSTYSETSLNSLNLYPNPADEMIYIDPFIPHNSDLSIYDADARLVLNKQLFQGQKIDVGDLPNGMYLFKIQDPQSNEISIHKMIINH